MLLIDDILLLPFTGPIAGVRWVLKQIQTMADEEMMNDQPWKERLIELQMMLEVGDITEEDYAQEEKVVFQKLREIRARKEEIARQAAADRGELEPRDQIGIYTGYGEDEK